MTKQNSNFIPKKTHPVLVEAGRLMVTYSRATGARICVNDHNYMPIEELYDEIATEKNICLFCMKHRKNTEVKGFRDFRHHPCKEMHSNALKEAHRFGGSFTYTCDLGFIFWTSPVYANEHFIGALVGSGYLGIDRKEVCARMSALCNGEKKDAELLKMLEDFKQGDPQKIKAMAELTLICAESLSVGSEECFAAMRRQARQQSEISAKIEEIKSKYSADEKRPEYPMDKERELLEALRRGDAKSCREILNDLLAFLIYTNPDQFKYIQYRAIELAVLLSRADTIAGSNSEVILEINNRYMKSIQEAKNIEELTDALFRIVDYMAGQIFSFQGIRHASALKKAEYYIMENFTRKISLKEIATASGFSAPYFSTIFKEEMGENLSSYINRLRVEKACYMLTETNLSLCNIAKTCGFEDQSWFSKIFKIYAGMTPGKYRNQDGKPDSKNQGTGLLDDHYLPDEK